MKKQTKIVAVLSAAALLVIGASMTSFAATGWVEEDGNWVYYDKNGYKVTDEWAKSGDGWYWLDSDGEMARDILIESEDNYYYVDSNGRMVANQWASVENTDDESEEAPDQYWYYFQANGKAYRAGTTGKTSFKTINGKKYTFSDEGKMLFGWVDGASSRQTGDDAWRSGSDYYCGDSNDGAMATGWVKMSLIDTTKEDEDQSYWFYFDPSTGKKVESKEKTINGKKYRFSSDGNMVDEWFEATTATASVATPNNYLYYGNSEDGSKAKGWFKVVPPAAMNAEAHADDTAKWFYADGSKGDIANSTLKTINGKKYAFNSKGEMLSGLQAIKFSSDGVMKSIVDNKKLENEDDIRGDIKGDLDGYTVMYFGDGEDGSMKTGNLNLLIDGESYTYSFEKSGSLKGKGIHGLDKKQNAVFSFGRRLKADADMKYSTVQVDESGTVLVEYLINTSGSVMKNKKNLKDGNDVYWCTDKDGHPVEHGSKKCGYKNDDDNTVYTCPFH